MASTAAGTATSAIEYAIALVAARSLPERKLRQKLALRYDADEIDGALARMRELGLVDDIAWAERFAAQRSGQRRYGRQRIRSELLARGIQAQAVDSALDRAIDAEGERERAAASIDALVRRAGGAASGLDQRAKSRIFRSMIRRGFDSSLVRELLGVITGAA